MKSEISFEEKLIKQIEYYFSDINLMKDKFLIQETSKNDGAWLPLDTLLTFNKLKSLGADSKKIIEIFRNHKSDLVEIDEEESQIRRSPFKPLPEKTEEYIKELRLRSIHLKGFPLDSQFDDIKAFCEQYGNVLSIEMRRTKEKTFKGCCFVIYDTQEDAERCLAGEQMYLESNTLKRENKVQYLERKLEFLAKRNKKRDEKKAKSEHIIAEVDLKQEAKEEGEKEEDEKPFLRNALLKITDIPEKCEVLELKKNFLKIYSSVFIDFVENSAYVRFKEANAALNVMNKLAGDDDVKEVTIKYKGEKLPVQLVTGDEEDSYWENIDCIIKISDLPENTNFGMVKDFLKKFDLNGYVVIEDSNGYIRFNSKKQADIVMESVDDDQSPFIKLNGKDVPICILTGNEKSEILKKMNRSNDNFKKNDRNSGKSKKNFHQKGGGYKGGFKRKGSHGGNFAKKQRY